jgi:hypothetical protein
MAAHMVLRRGLRLGGKMGRDGMKGLRTARTLTLDANAFYGW